MRRRVVKTLIRALPFRRPPWYGALTVPGAVYARMLAPPRGKLQRNRLGPSSAGTAKICEPSPRERVARGRVRPPGPVSSTRNAGNRSHPEDVGPPTFLVSWRQTASYTSMRCWYGLLVQCSRHPPKNQPHGDRERIPMNLSFPHIAVMLVGSAVGYVYLSWGRSQSNLSLAATGIALMAYSYFFSSLLWLIVVGVVLAVAPYACKRFF